MSCTTSRTRTLGRSSASPEAPSWPSSKKQAQAQQFLKFITGKEGQQVLQTGDSFEYTVDSDVPANPKLVPLNQLQAPIDPAKIDSEKVTGDYLINGVSGGLF